jgi:DNA-directed RNA polymerase subunit RPC12/RpoP
MVKCVKCGKQIRRPDKPTTDGRCTNCFWRDLAVNGRKVGIKVIIKHGEAL